MLDPTLDPTVWSEQLPDVTSVPGYVPNLGPLFDPLNHSQSQAGKTSGPGVSPPFQWSPLWSMLLAVFLLILIASSLPKNWGYNLAWLMLLGYAAIHPTNIEAGLSAISRKVQGALAPQPAQTTNSASSGITPNFQQFLSDTLKGVIG